MPQKKLSDTKGINFAYALLMEAIDSNGQLNTLSGKTKELFEGYLEVKLSEEEVEKIKPDLEEMLELVRDSGVVGQAKLGDYQDRKRLGTSMQITGSRMSRGEDLPIGETLAQGFMGAINMNKEILRTFISIFSKIAQKIGFSRPEQNVYLAGMVKKINQSRKETQDRAITLTGAAMKQALGSYSSREIDKKKLSSAPSADSPVKR